MKRLVENEAMFAFDSISALRKGDSRQFATERMQINVLWLYKLRWAAVIGQLATIGFVVVVLKVDIAWLWLVAIVGVMAVTNGLLGVWLARSHTLSQSSAERLEWILGGLMLLDILLLTAILALSGGPANPFTIFYLVNISLAAAVTRPRWAIVLGAIAFISFVLLFDFHVSVATLGHDHHGLLFTANQHHGHHEATAPLREEAGATMNLHLRGMLVAFGGACAFIVYFVTRVTSELSRRDLELNLARERREHMDRLEGLATLAAGAAHELATPLSTVAILARELEAGMVSASSSPEAAAEAREIRSQVDRCQQILHRMTVLPGGLSDEPMTEVTVAKLVEEATSVFPNRSRIESTCVDDCGNLVVWLPKSAIVQSLRAILKNALDASPAGQPIHICANAAEEYLDISVRDEGLGMPTDVVDRAGEPFFTTKESGSGMGLGLFIASRVCLRLGGELRLQSETGSGTTATIHVPLLESSIAAS